MPTTTIPSKICSLKYLERQWERASYRDRINKKYIEKQLFIIYLAMILKIE